MWWFLNPLGGTLYVAKSEFSKRAGFCRSRLANYNLMKKTKTCQGPKCELFPDPPHPVGGALGDPATQSAIGEKRSVFGKSVIGF